MCTFFSLCTRYTNVSVDTLRWSVVRGDFELSSCPLSPRERSGTRRKIESFVDLFQIHVSRWRSRHDQLAQSVFKVYSSITTQIGQDEKARQEINQCLQTPLARALLRVAKVSVRKFVEKSSRQYQLHSLALGIAKSMPSVWEVVKSWPLEKKKKIFELALVKLENFESGYLLDYSRADVEPEVHVLSGLKVFLTNVDLCNRAGRGEFDFDWFLTNHAYFCWHDEPGKESWLVFLTYCADDTKFFSYYVEYIRLGNEIATILSLEHLLKVLVIWYEGVSNVGEKDSRSLTKEEVEFYIRFYESCPKGFADLISFISTYRPSKSFFEIWIRFLPYVGGEGALVLEGIFKWLPAMAKHETSLEILKKCALEVSPYVWHNSSTYFKENVLCLENGSSQALECWFNLVFFYKSWATIALVDVGKKEVRTQLIQSICEGVFASDAEVVAWVDARNGSDFCRLPSGKALTLEQLTKCNLKGLFSNFISSEQGVSRRPLTRGDLKCYHKEHSLWMHSFDYVSRWIDNGQVSIAKCALRLFFRHPRPSIAIKWSIWAHKQMLQGRIDYKKFALLAETLPVQQAMDLLHIAVDYPEVWAKILDKIQSMTADTRVALLDYTGSCNQLLKRAVACYAGGYEESYRKLLISLKKYGVDFAFDFSCHQEDLIDKCYAKWNLFFERAGSELIQALAKHSKDHLYYGLDVILSFIDVDMLESFLSLNREPAFLGLGIWRGRFAVGNGELNKYLNFFIFIIDGPFSKETKRNFIGWLYSFKKGETKYHPLDTLIQASYALEWDEALWRGIFILLRSSCASVVIGLLKAINTDEREEVRETLLEMLTYIVTTGNEEALIATVQLYKRRNEPYWSDLFNWAIANRRSSFFTEYFKISLILALDNGYHELVLKYIRSQLPESTASHVFYFVQHDCLDAAVHFMSGEASYPFEDFAALPWLHERNLRALQVIEALNTDSTVEVASYLRSEWKCIIESALEMRNSSGHSVECSEEAIQKRVAIWFMITSSNRFNLSSDGPKREGVDKRFSIERKRRREEIDRLEQFTVSLKEAFSTRLSSGIQLLAKNLITESGRINQDLAAIIVSGGTIDQIGAQPYIADHLKSVLNTLSKSDYFGSWLQNLSGNVCYKPWLPYIRAQYGLSEEVVIPIQVYRQFLLSALLTPRRQGLEASCAAISIAISLGTSGKGALMQYAEDLLNVLFLGCILRKTDGAAKLFRPRRAFSLPSDDHLLCYVFERIIINIPLTQQNEDKVVLRSVLSHISQKQSWENPKLELRLRELLYHADKTFKRVHVSEIMQGSSTPRKVKKDSCVLLDHEGKNVSSLDQYIGVIAYAITCLWKEKWAGLDGGEAPSQALVIEWTEEVLKRREGWPVWFSYEQDCVRNFLDPYNHSSLKGAPWIRPYEGRPIHKLVEDYCSKPSTGVTYLLGNHNVVGFIEAVVEVAKTYGDKSRIRITLPGHSCHLMPQEVLAWADSLHENISTQKALVYSFLEAEASFKQIIDWVKHFELSLGKRGYVIFTDRLEQKLKPISATELSFLGTHSPSTPRLKWREVIANFMNYVEMLSASDKNTQNLLRDAENALRKYFIEQGYSLPNMYTFADSNWQVFPHIGWSISLLDGQPHVYSYNDKCSQKVAPMLSTVKEMVFEYPQCELRLTSFEVTRFRRRADLSKICNQ